MEQYPHYPILSLRFMPHISAILAWFVAHRFAHILSPQQDVLGAFPLTTQLL